MGFLVLSMLFFLMRTLCNKEYTKSFSSRQSNFVFNAISMTITCLVAALFGGVKNPPASCWCSARCSALFS